MSQNNSKIINLPKIQDPRGNLSFAEAKKHIPFEIKRAFWIYDVPGGEMRGGHAYKTQEEFIISLSGSVDVVIDNGEYKTIYVLNRSYFGLYVPPMHWRQMINFSTNSIVLVLSSSFYNENDYIRDYAEFLKMIKKS